MLQTSMHMRKQFTGLWVGESMGIESSPAHLWRVRQEGSRLFIYHRWENEAQEHSSHFDGYLADDQRLFTFLTSKIAYVIDDEHFVIPGWDTNDIRGGKGPAFDVVFSRPGLAELQARKAWEVWSAQTQLASGDK